MAGTPSAVVVNFLIVNIFVNLRSLVMALCLSDTACPCRADTDGDVTLEFELPFWIEEEDVQVDISSTQLSVFVQNELSFRRTYWRNRLATT